MAHSIPIVPLNPPPPPRPARLSLICRAVVILPVPVVGICQKTSAWGWGVSQFS